MGEWMVSVALMLFVTLNLLSKSSITSFRDSTGEDVLSTPASGLNNAEIHEHSQVADQGRQTVSSEGNSLFTISIFFVVCLVRWLELSFHIDCVIFSPNKEGSFVVCLARGILCMSHACFCA